MIRGNLIHLYRATLLSGASLLVGCAHYQAQPLNLPASAKLLASRTLTDTDLQQRLQESGAGVPVNGWTRAQLLVAAAERNPKLLAARARVQEASAATKTARALPNPTITLGSEYDLSQASESPWLWSISTDWLLDVGLRRRIREQLADTQLQAARVDYAEALWTVRNELRSALLNYLLNDQRRVVLTRAVADQERLLALQKQRISLGEAATGEASLVELELARARSNMMDNTRSQAAALTQIAQSIGVPLDAVRHLSFNWDDLMHVTEVDDVRLDNLRDAALLSRADLERAVLDYQSRELELRQAVRQQYPQLSVGPGYTWDHGIKKATLGVAFSLPLFNRNQGPIAEAEARRAAAGEQVLAVQAQALNEIASTRDAYQVSVQALQAVLQQSEAADALVQQATLSLSLGDTDQIGVITAKMNSDTQSLAVLDAIERMQQSLGQLEDSLRTPLSGSELALGKSALLNPFSADPPTK